jgi:hypothetical protein
MSPSQTTLRRPLLPRAPLTVRRSGTSLARYTDRDGREREIVRLPGAHGSALVVDRAADNLGDERLVAHLCPDEPQENARIISSLYLSDPRGRRCRALKHDDLHGAPLDWTAEQQALADQAEAPDQEALVDQDGFAYELAEQGLLAVRELRWQRRPPDGSAEPVTLRQVIGALQSYEPARAQTAQALQRHDGDREISVTCMRGEFDRITSSSIVLNRGLREAMLATIQRDGVTLSEIAIRCGRIKRDENGNESGETSWLARRVGVLPEGGRRMPTPWVSSDVLALIAREGLGLAPREVELTSED